MYSKIEINHQFNINNRNRNKVEWPLQIDRANTVMENRAPEA